MADDILKEAREAYAECQERDEHNHVSFEKDIRFSRLEEQWPERSHEDPDWAISTDARLTINKLAPIIRQVVNDARQNKPAITVRPQDNDADPETAEIMTGLIRNIEQSSDADIAYDTAVDHAVSGGFGYFRINLEYACDDSWDQDIVIQRIANPLSVHGDPYSTAADSSDWDVCFVTDRLSEKQFRREYKGAQATGWELSDYPEGWIEGEDIVIAEYWKREKVRKKLIQLANPATGDAVSVLEDDMAERGAELYEKGFTQPMQSREVMSYDVKQRIVSGVEVLDEVEWAGRYIPIVPVYGDEIVLKGKRYFRSLIRSAIDAQRMYNYWASKTTDVVALAPRSPYIGEEGAFDVDPNWDRINDASIPYVEYAKDRQPPQRQPFTGVPTGMMQEMMNAAEHIKAVTGIYDASLGARSNETSGVAIRNRQLEGDTSTFHFIDNLSRAIRHGGRILIDLIPKVYNTERMVRVLGEDGKAQNVPLGQPVPVMGPDGQPMTQEGPVGEPVPVTRIYDLSLGKYDLAVEAGPSYTSRREETRAELVEIIRAVPDAAMVLGPMYLRNSDWPGAQEAADKLEAMTNPQQPEIPEELQQQIEAGVQELEQLRQENQQLKSDGIAKMAEIDLKNREADQKDRELDIKEIEATARLVAAQRHQMVDPDLNRQDA